MNAGNKRRLGDNDLLGIYTSRSDSISIILFICNSIISRFFVSKQYLDEPSPQLVTHIALYDGLLSTRSRGVTDSPAAPSSMTSVLSTLATMEFASLIVTEYIRSPQAQCNTHL